LHHKSTPGLLFAQIFEEAENVSNAGAYVWLGVSSAMTAASVPRCAHSWRGACCEGGKAVPLRDGCRETSVTGWPRLWGKGGRGPLGGGAACFVVPRCGPFLAG